MIVADTNVIAYLLIEGEKTKHATALLEQDSNWVAPLLWSSEFRNVLSLYLRKNLMDMEEVAFLLMLAETLLANNEHRVASVDVMNLVSSSNCSSYDCEFVALAQKLNIKLVTNDKKVLKAFPETAVSLDIYTT